MSLSIRTPLRSRKGFTLPEVLLTTFIAMYVVGAAVSVYAAACRWWAETAPAIETQRVARLALSRVVEGVRQDSLGSDTVSSTTYRRRNGLAEAVLTNANPTPDTPAITTPSAGQNAIAFRTESDTSNSRTYEIGTVSTGVQALYYSGTVVPATRIGTATGPGRIYLTCASVSGYTDLYQITVRAEKDVRGTRRGVSDYTVATQLTDYVYLRNK